jgi:hypothetical protein
LIFNYNSTITNFSAWKKLLAIWGEPKYRIYLRIFWIKLIQEACEINHEIFTRLHARLRWRNLESNYNKLRVISWIRVGLMTLVLILEGWSAASWTTR